jgi:hypothetical protein
MAGLWRGGTSKTTFQPFVGGTRSRVNHESSTWNMGRKRPLEGPEFCSGQMEVHPGAGPSRRRGAGCRRGELVGLLMVVECWFSRARAHLAVAGQAPEWIRSLGEGGTSRAGSSRRGSHGLPRFKRDHLVIELPLVGVPKRQGAARRSSPSIPHLEGSTPFRRHDTG